MKNKIKQEQRKKDKRDSIHFFLIDIISTILLGISSIALLQKKELAMI